MTPPMTALEAMAIELWHEPLGHWETAMWELSGAAAVLQRMGWTKTAKTAAFLSNIAEIRWELEPLFTEDA